MRAAPEPSLRGWPPDSAALARFLAHEINNIAVPLQGFIDLAGAGVSGETLAQCLDEVRISTTRLLELSRDIAAFDDDGGPARRVSLRECLPEGVAPAFKCDPGLPVLAEASSIRRSVEQLLRVATSPLQWMVHQNDGYARHCHVCGAELAPVLALIELRAPRLPGAAALANPFDPACKLRALQRLRLAAVAHAAHLGGAHLMAAPAADGVAIALAVL